MASCPDESLPEFAFIGRSNVGKSSLLNMLAGKNGLARTSPTPGFTKLINIFTMNKTWRLVDLPGYGFAQVAQKDSSKFNRAVADYRFRTPMATVTPFDQPRTAVRQYSNPLVAAWQGVVETRDFILQFYVTLRRMVTGDVGVRNMMGPVGIFQAGTSFASKGNDWLIWFLAMISANLAVVNFLPIPIVDGGLFTFLIWEKIKGKPLSPKAQAIAQYVGMALLLGIFLFVTYQDVIWFKFRR